jgi:hypothetical protein
MFYEADVRAGLQIANALSEDGDEDAPYFSLESENKITGIVVVVDRYGRDLTPGAVS